MKFIHRYALYFVAALFPLLTFSWFIPKGVAQIDLWLLWLVAMVLVGLPMLFLELALSRRTTKTVWQGMQALTRDSDASTYWRVFSALSVLLALFLGSKIIVQLSETLTLFDFAQSLGISRYAIGFGLTVIALIISPLKQKLLICGLIATLIAAILCIPYIQIQPTMTEVHFKEWSLALIMTLFSVGMGTGLYWFLDNQNPQTQNNKSAIFYVAFPVWLLQIVFGAIGFLVAHAPLSPVASVFGALGALLVAAFLFDYGISQLAVRFGFMKAAVIFAVPALVFTALPSFVLWFIVVSIGLLAALCLSVFAGFVMKSSHLRKSLNFKNELRYNLWRIAVRWIIPLAIVLAVIGWWF